jgi:hypothetical protein
MPKPQLNLAIDYDYSLDEKPVMIIDADTMMPRQKKDIDSRLLWERTFDVTCPAFTGGNRGTVVLDSRTSYYFRAFIKESFLTYSDGSGFSGSLESSGNPNTSYINYCVSHQSTTGPLVLEVMARDTLAAGIKIRVTVEFTKV